MFKAFYENPVLAAIICTWLISVEAYMFEYTLYTFTGRDINFLYDMYIASIMTFFMRIYYGKDGEEIGVGNFIIEWGWMISFIIRTFFEVQLPLWTI